MGTVIVAAGLLVGCSSTGANAGLTKECGAAVDRFAAAQNNDALSDAAVEPIARASLEACSATGWEVAAKIDDIPFGNTDVHDVLAAVCADEDPGKSTAPCSDSLIAPLVDAKLNP